MASKSKKSERKNPQLEELESVAEQLGVRVSYEPMNGQVQGVGGLCRVRGEYRVIVDRRFKAPERVQVLADALRRFDTTALEMSRSTRALLEPPRIDDPAPSDDAAAGTESDAERAEGEDERAADDASEASRVAS